MQNKVTSYTTSKALADAGFDSEAHCGWWSRKYADQYLPDIPGQRLIVLEDEAYKAYCCHDLIQYLRKYLVDLFFDKEEVEICATLQSGSFLGDSSNEVFARDFQPQEALAQAILEVLKND